MPLGREVRTFLLRGNRLETLEVDGARPPSHVTQATSWNRPAIARIHMNSRAATMPYLPPQKRSQDQVTQWVKDVLLTSCRTWVAVRDGEILGFAALDGDMLEHLPAPSTSSTGSRSSTSATVTGTWSGCPT
jgi:hypothetical protein